MKVPFFNSLAEAGRHVVQFIGGIIIVTAAAVSLYFIFDQRIEAADVKAESANKFAAENKLTVKEVDKKVDDLKESVSRLNTQQMLLQKDIDSDRRSSMEFQVRTDTALSRILDKLDRLGGAGR